MNTTSDTLLSHPYIIPHKETNTQINNKGWITNIVQTSINYEKSNVFYKGISRQTHTQPWMLLLLLFGYIAIAFSRSAYRKRFNLLFASFLNWKLSKQIIRYENVYAHPVNIVLTLNFLFCVPLFFSFFFQTASTNTHLARFGMVFIPLIAYLIIKFLLYRFSTWLFGQKEALGEYVFQTNLFNKYLGVAYLILNTLLVYSPIKIEILYSSSIITLLLFLVLQIVRGIIIGIERGNALLFIILYLCTLEIFPWLVMGKWISNYL